MNNQKLLDRINLLERLANAVVQEATMLKKELSGVVSDNSSRKGLSVETKLQVLAKRQKKRFQTNNKY